MGYKENDSQNGQRNILEEKYIYNLQIPTYKNPPAMPAVKPAKPEKPNEK